MPSGSLALSFSHFINNSDFLNPRDVRTNSKHLTNISPDSVFKTIMDNNIPLVENNASLLRTIPAFAVKVLCAYSAAVTVAPIGLVFNGVGTVVNIVTGILYVIPYGIGFRNGALICGLEASIKNISYYARGCFADIAYSATIIPPLFAFYCSKEALVAKLIFSGLTLLVTKIIQSPQILSPKIRRGLVLKQELGIADKNGNAIPVRTGLSIDSSKRISGPLIDLYQRHIKDLKYGVNLMFTSADQVKFNVYKLNDSKVSNTLNICLVLENFIKGIIFNPVTHYAYNFRGELEPYTTGDVVDIPALIRSA
ncbi:MAG: hypothetical protein WC222_10370 [Parachlamydiales bacterium]|jgi:hypothetical protein